MKSRFLLGLLAASVLFSTVPAVSMAKHDNNGHGKGKGNNHAHEHKVDSHDKDHWDRGSHSGGYTYNYNRTHINSALLAALSGQSQYSLNTKALKRQQQMPPGIAKNLQRGKALPPGIAKKMYYLPHAGFGYYGIDRRYSAGVYGDNLIVHTAAGVIVDILTNVF